MTKSAPAQFAALTWRSTQSPPQRYRSGIGRAADALTPGHHDPCIDAGIPPVRCRSPIRVDDRQTTASPLNPALAFLALFAVTALVAAFEPLRFAVETLIAEGGRAATLYSLLLLPVGVLAIVFFRLVIGLETFGLFAPLILAFAFAFAKVSPLVGVAVVGVLLVLVSPVGLWLTRFPLLSTARTGSLLVLSSLLLLAGFALSRSPTSAACAGRLRRRSPADTCACPRGR